MSGTTTNNGWTYPTSTDYVKDGATAIQTAIQGVDTSVGTGLLAWTAYTPTTTGITLGTGYTMVAYYSKLGKTVNMKIKLTLGTGGALTNIPTFSLPVNSANTNFDGLTAIGNSTAVVGGIYYGGTNNLSGNTINPVFGVVTSATSPVRISNYGPVSPGIFTTGSQIVIVASYECV